MAIIVRQDQGEEVPEECKSAESSESTPCSEEKIPCLGELHASMHPSPEFTGCLCIKAEMCPEVSSKEYWLNTLLTNFAFDNVHLATFMNILFIRDIFLLVTRMKRIGRIHIPRLKRYT